MQKPKMNERIFVLISVIAWAVVFFILVAVLAIAQLTATRKKEVQQ